MCIRDRFGLVRVVCATTVRVNPSHPLKPLTWCLSHPVHIVAGEAVSGSLAGDLHGGPRLPHLGPRLHQLDLGVDTCGQETAVGAEP